MLIEGWCHPVPCWTIARLIVRRQGWWLGVTPVSSLVEALYFPSCWTRKSGNSNASDPDLDRLSNVVFVIFLPTLIWRVKTLYYFGLILIKGKQIDTWIFFLIHRLDRFWVLESLHIIRKAPRTRKKKYLTLLGNF